tara:strand:- start:1207 stop:1311 length:105 start_codon:yes stop_codon:yes gene_type:complete
MEEDTTIVNLGFSTEETSKAIKTPKLNAKSPKGY